MDNLLRGDGIAGRAGRTEKEVMELIRKGRLIESIGGASLLNGITMFQEDVQWVAPPEGAYGLGYYVIADMHHISAYRLFHMFLGAYF